MEKTQKNTKWPKPRKHVKGRRMEIIVNESDLDGWGETVAFVEVRRKDGKSVRYWLSLRIPGDTRAGQIGEVYANLSTRSANRDIDREMKGYWVDWDENQKKAIEKINAIKLSEVV